MPPPGPARRQRAGPWLGRSCLHSPRPPSCLHQAGRAARAAHPGPLPAREAPWGSRDTLGIPRLLHAHKDPPVSPAMGMGSWRGGGGGGAPSGRGCKFPQGFYTPKPFPPQTAEPPRLASITLRHARATWPTLGDHKPVPGPKAPKFLPPAPPPPPERGQQSVPTPREDR